MISSEQVAEALIEGMEAERFLIPPLPGIERFIQFKTANHDCWTGGMRKLRRNTIDEIDSTRLEDMHKLV